MRKSALNLLWQQKRADLPIDENPQADWAEMDKLLNVQMPVSNGAIGTQSVFKTMLAHIARYKLLVTIAALVASGTGAYFLFDHNATVQTKHHDHQEIKANNDAQNTPANNLPVTDSAVNNKSVSDDNKTAATGDETNIENKASVPANGTNVGTTNAANGDVVKGISNSENTPLPAVSNNKPAIVKRSGANNNVASLPANTLTGNKLVLRSSRGTHNYFGNGRTNLHNSVSQSVRRNTMQADIRKTGDSEPGTGKSANGLPDYTLHQQKQDIVQLWPPQLVSWDTYSLLTKNANYKLPGKVLEVNSNIKAPASPKIKNKKDWALPIDWGLLGGINTPGSFTAANNRPTNSVPFDAYAGLFASYDLNDKWSVNLQARLPSPHQARGEYSHTEAGKTDTAGMQTVNSKISDTRKMYMVDIPLHLVYRVNPNIGIKGGPVLSIPLTDANGISTVTTTGTLKDSVAYFYKMSEALNNTKMERKIYYGISGGVSLSYGRLLLDATFYHNFQAQKVSSSLGGYTSNNNTLQIAVGFRLNKKRQ